MDPFEQMIRKKNRRVVWISVLICLFLAVLTAAGLYGFIFHYNRFSIALELQGADEITLEYEETYSEPGASALFAGTRLMEEGMELPVIVSGHVDTGTVGTYTLYYSASYQNWSATTTRTVHVVDTVPPVIVLLGKPDTYVLPGEEYVEEGFKAVDNYDGDLTDQVRRFVDGGRISYFVRDSSGNTAELFRDIVYYDPIPPELMLKGETSITITVGDKYKEPGYSATDNCDGDVTDRVEISGNVNIYRAGTYTLTYTVKDDYGNTDTATRTVKVKAKPKPQNQSGTNSASGKVIYLTFDDGPSKYTRQLLEVLAKYNVKATFFVCNTGYVSMLPEIAAAGHSIGIHSYTHTYKQIYASEEAFFSDLTKMQGVIESKTGVSTTLMRFPGGSSNTVSRFNPGIMTRLTASVEDMGYQYFDWNVNSCDAGGTTSAEGVYQNVINGIKGRSMAVVLQHDTKSYSVNAVEKIIIWGLENGYTFLPLNSGSPTAHHGVNN